MPVDRFLSMTKESAEKAANCEKCGECEERCPYGLPIREMMDESLALYRREKATHDSTSTSS
jgi:predicted aldo/keto reductase-like oxidoreductase